jgi:hypothetical protein
MAKQQGLAPKALKHYGDKLRYFFALSRNALPLQKKVIISYICHSVVCTIGNRFPHLCQVPTDSFPQSMVGQAPHPLPSVDLFQEALDQGKCLLLCRAHLQLLLQA